jgi:UDP-N-acetylglucosamine--N-acetylmuramyl-(pentapeptide) pyrophosphoryl-undecaprenol N-acetylglucosamine transferase
MFAGGGTGGHIFPAIAIAEELKALMPNCEISFVGSRWEFGKQRIGETAQIYSFAAYSWTGKGTLGMLRLLPLVLVSILRAMILLKKLQPDIVIGTGAYPSVPVLAACCVLRVPYVLHEQNAIPGRANRFFEPYAKEVFLAFPEARRFFKRKEHLCLTGNPLRRTLFAGNGVRARRKFRLHKTKKTVFVMGGSLGAKSLNKAAVSAFFEFRPDEGIQFVVQTGARGYDWVRAKARRARFPVAAVSFADRIEDIYELADVIVCRAGAMTIAEVLACGIPSILVPYPYASDDHQMENARNVVDRGAAVIIPDHELTGKRLVSEIRSIVKDEVRFRAMKAHARRYARLSASRKIVKRLEEIFQEHTSKAGIRCTEGLGSSILSG